MKTYTPKSGEITREWHLVDAEGMIIGRMATEVARLLRAVPLQEPWSEERAVEWWEEHVPAGAAVGSGGDLP